MTLISKVVKLNFILICVVNTLGEYHHLKESYFMSNLSYHSNNDKIPSSISTSLHYDNDEGADDNLSSHLIDHQTNHKNITTTVFLKQHKRLSDADTNNSITCGGAFKSYQTILTSPNYPNEYPAGIRCVYIIKSPFLCRNIFHIQFLDFRLESSKDCEKDWVTIGEMDKFCGQIIGINEYNSSDGVLRVEFHSDEFTQEKGFKLLITRLPCQLQSESESEFNDINRTLNTEKGVVMPQLDILPPMKRSNQYLPPTGYLPSIPSYPIPSNFPSSKPTQPCNRVFPIYPSYPEYLIPTITSNTNHNLYPIDKTITWRPSQSIYFGSLPKVESQIAPWLLYTIPSCCLTSFKQKRFYLSSPGFFVGTTNQLPKDCLYYIEKSGPGVCRLRIVFKFFFIGNNNQNCEEDFVEIDNQRICGCQTGLIYTSQWGYGAKVIRLKTSGKQYYHNNGFILDVIQEDCPYRYSNELPINQNRMVQNHKVLVKKDPTSRTTYAVQSIQKNEEQTEHEGPSSQFLFPRLNSCTFTLTDYIRLSLESLWIQKPNCIIT